MNRAIIVLLILAGLLFPPAAAGAPAFGVVSQAHLAPAEFETMGEGGVKTLRFLVSWRSIEPEPNSYDWSGIDPIVAGAQAEGIRLLPMVYGVPRWLATDENLAPVADADSRAAWQGFLTVLAARYGPGGSFFAGGPEMPIRRWQIWNEPNFDYYWKPPQSAADYGRLVKLSTTALRRVDPRAKVVLAGVAAVRSGVPWAGFMRDLLAVPRIERSFDFVGFHPYSHDVADLRAQIERMRRLLARSGFSKARLAVTEIGWASDGDTARPLVVGAAQQAALLRRSFALLSEPGLGWRISDVQWYAWQDTGAVELGCSFCEHAGLFDTGGRPKPAWNAFRRAVSGG